MKKTSLALTLAASMAACQMASAITITGSVGGAPVGANHVNFDDLTPTGVGGTYTANGPSGSVDVTVSPNGKIVTGSVTGQYAAPFVSGGNGNGFGSQPDGPDTTVYLTSGRTGDNGSIVLTFGSDQLYFGLLWGSVDDYNTLTFYDQFDNVVDTVTGVDVTASPDGDQGVNGTLYVNIDTTSAFRKVVATSSQFAFEIDNVAYSERPQQTVPDGGTTITLLGAALTGLALFRKKSAVA